ncbi:AfsR/SARP family transcriptional regulator [Phytoactinopolyspora endophytica]|uniref:AfsR/SARP family transcriptional regulator n=1 Tax=Phytoactinopolyspora endophytica TaxID=1642495 RepID=UPI0013EC05B7|nr:BTAD domain-containing putative transcriptional regulator [Phytoactinopolyspora endophytica]
MTIDSPHGVLEQADFLGRQGRLAFVYLAESPRRVERHQLAEAIWGDSLPDAWDTALNAIVSKLRRTLSRVGVDASNSLEGSYGCYELRLPAGTWIDLREAMNSLDFAEGAVVRGDARAAWPAAAVASAILRRPFLSGEDLPWVEQRRRELHELEVRTYDTLANAWLQVGNGPTAVAAARRAVALAPYRESVYARLMECHVAAGDRAEAVRVYTELRDLLSEVMGISPAPEVEHIYLEALGHRRTK